jgi:hypothetical protein
VPAFEVKGTNSLIVRLDLEDIAKGASRLVKEREKRAFHLTRSSTVRDQLRKRRCESYLVLFL